MEPLSKERIIYETVLKITNTQRSFDDYINDMKSDMVANAIFAVLADMMKQYSDQINRELLDEQKKLKDEKQQLRDAINKIHIASHGLNYWPSIAAIRNICLKTLAPK